jgi:DNA-binding CsgD family transcriptional regulator
MAVYAQIPLGYLTRVTGGREDAVGGRSARLSARELDVMAGLAIGDSTDQIGVALGMSPHTVRTHLRNIMRKLEARTRAHAVAIAIGDGAIDPPPVA